ncbi:DinB/UmuC family translesion DNA polymerase [Vreelandella sulfidaeris]
MRRTDDSHDIIASAVQGLRRLWRKGYAYHKAGLMLLDLSPKANWQLTSLKLRKPTKRLSEANASWRR